MELVDWTGRQLRPGKRGSIHNSTPPILDRLQLETAHWLYLTQHFESTLKGLVGTINKLKQACDILGYQRMPERSPCARYFA